MLMATAMYPPMKLHWMVDEERRKNIEEALIKELEVLIRSSEESASETPPEAPSAKARSSSDLQSYLLQVYSGHSQLSQNTNNLDRRVGEAQSFLRSFLTTSPLVLSAGMTLKGVHFPHPDVFQLFLKMNTPMMSSAAAERLFSKGRHLIHYLRSSLSDSSVEACLLGSVNSKLHRGERKESEQADS